MLGRMLGIGLFGGRVMLVDEATGEVRWAVQAHAGTQSTTCVASGRFLASSGGADENWKLWDAASGAVLMVGARHGTGACICEVDNFVHRLVQEGCPEVAHTAVIGDLAFSPCGRRFASGDLDGAVILWDIQTGGVEHRMQGHRHGVASLSFSADGERLACGCGDGSICIWEMTIGRLLRTIPRQSSVISMVNFSPTDSRALATLGHNLLRLVDVESGEMIKSFEAHVFLVFSPDGCTIATASAGGACDVLLVDVESGAVRLRLVGHLGYVSAATFSVEDGSTIASGSHDGTCKVWDSSTGALLRTIDVGDMICSVVSGRDWVRDT